MLDARRNQLLQLLLYKSYSNMRAESSRLRGGILWWIMEPLLQMLIYYVVFAVLLQQKTEHFVWFLLIGLLSWRWFQTTVSQGAGSIIGGKGLMQQVYVSKIIFPSIVLISNSAKFIAGFLVLLLLLWGFGHLPSLAYLALPLVLAVQFLWIAACAYLCAAIVPFLPDMKIVIDNSMRALMFLSGIFFDGRTIPDEAKFWFYLNPMASLIQSYRDILLDGISPEWGYLLGIGAVSCVGIAVGKYLISRFDYIYPRVVI